MLVEYDRALAAAGIGLVASGCPISQLHVLVDASGFDVQTQALMADYEQRLGPPGCMPRRMATIMSGSLQRMQAKRLAFPNRRIFADEAEAMV